MTDSCLFAYLYSLLAGYSSYIPFIRVFFRKQLHTPVICQILKKSDRDDIATVVSIVGLILVLTIVVSMVGDLFVQIKQIFDLT